MRYLIALALLSLSSCVASAPDRTPPVDRSDWPVYTIEEPFRIIREEKIQTQNPLITNALLGVWEVDGGDGWISLDVSTRRKVSVKEAEAAIDEFSPAIEAAAAPHGLHSAYAKICEVETGNQYPCLDLEYRKTSKSRWKRK